MSFFLSIRTCFLILLFCILKSPVVVATARTVENSTNNKIPFSFRRSFIRRNNNDDLGSSEKTVQQQRQVLMASRTPEQQQQQQQHRRGRRRRRRQQPNDRYTAKSVIPSVIQSQADVSATTTVASKFMTRSFIPHRLRVALAGGVAGATGTGKAVLYPLDNAKS